MPDQALSISLRDYQEEAIEELRLRFADGARRLALVLPTGGGKTRIAAAMAAGAVARGRRVLVVAHLRELITQARDRFAELGLEAGLILAGHLPRPHLPIQIGSIQTLTRRAIPEADLVILDECHRAAASSYQRLLEALPEARVVGLTATPVRGDGKGLEDIFEGAVIGSTAAELIERGVLVRPRVLAPQVLDLSSVRVQRGDYVAADLEKVMAGRRIIGDVLSTWIQHGYGRRTVAFGVTVAHAQLIAGAFNGAGIPAATVTGETPPEERVATFDRLRRGEVLVLANCGVLCEGWDMPEVEVGILARPTKSRGLYIQQAGRVLRSAPGKTHAILLDHAGNVYVHGLPQDYAPIGLEPAREQRPQPTKGCPECETRVSLSTRICPHCDYFWAEAIGERPPIEVEVVSGELVEVGGEPPLKAPSANQMRYFESQCREAHSRGYKPGWAMHRFKARFGFWPDTPPFNEVRAKYWPTASQAS